VFTAGQAFQALVHTGVVASGDADDVATRRKTTYWQGIGDMFHFVVLVEPHSAAINWRRNPPMDKKKPYTVNRNTR
jgi:hypothetical protein